MAPATIAELKKYVAKFLRQNLQPHDASLLKWTDLRKTLEEHMKMSVLAKYNDVLPKTSADWDIVIEEAGYKKGFKKGETDKLFQCVKLDGRPVTDGCIATGSPTTANWLQAGVGKSFKKTMKGMKKTMKGVKKTMKGMKKTMKGTKKNAKPAFKNMVTLDQQTSTVPTVRTLTNVRRICSIVMRPIRSKNIDNGVTWTLLVDKLKSHFGFGHKAAERFMVQAGYSKVRYETPKHTNGIKRTATNQWMIKK